MDERSYWLGFSSFSGIGPGKFSLLLENFGSAKSAWGAGSEELEEVLGKALASKFAEFREDFSIKDYDEKLKKAKVYFLTITDKEYPALLKQIQKPPFVLYIKGDKSLLDPLKNTSTIAIVGTRRITTYGRQVTESLTQDLVQAGFVVVSGLALGVDAKAHMTTIENKGKTIAVLGCGVDCCYPRENQKLYEEILDSGGLIVSEYSLGEPPAKGSFPSRNRIIAGLSHAVLVTEGAADSGALYTATEAFTLSRPVFAVPGPITSSLSRGPHSLFAKGGKLIGSAEDIIAELRIKNKKLRIGKAGGNPLSQSRFVKTSRDERKIIDILQNESVHFDEIARKTKIKSSRLGGILSIMEMKGMVKRLDAGCYCLG